MAQRPSNEDLSGVLEDYLAAVDAGRAPDRNELLARHPEFERELGLCLTALDFIRGLDSPTDRLLGDFRIRREIGRGGMGVVYEADQLSLGRRVALKMLPFAGILDPRQLQRFRNEAQAAAHLHHAHIVPVHAVGQERGVHYYAMQLIDGISLSELIDELRQVAGRDEPRRPSSAALQAITGPHGTRSAGFARAVARLGIQAAEALDHAHGEGVVHRDVKPANLIVDGSGHLWITDFGLASFTTASGPTITGDLVGTVRYMSPEQALAKRVPIDHRTDIYSLGVTLYELLTLQQAFPGDDPHRVIQDIALREPAAIRRHNAAVPAELETIVAKAMAKRADDRYASAAELAEDLGRFLENRPILARRPGPLKRATQWSRRHRTVVWAAAVVLVLAAAGFAVSSLLIWRAYRSEKQAHDRSATNLELALKALDELYLEEGRQRLQGTPLLTETDRRFLERGLRFYDQFIEANENDAGVRWEVARAYIKAGQIRSLLGDSEQALRDFRLAGGILEGLEATQPLDSDRRQVLALNHVSLSRVLLGLGRLEESEAEAREARRILDGLEGDDPRLDGSRAEAEEALAGVAGMGRRLDEALMHYDEAGRLLQSLLDRGLANPEERWRLGQVRAGRSWILRKQGRLEEAERACAEAVALQEQLVKVDPGDLRFAQACANARVRLGGLLVEMGRSKEGLEIHREARGIFEGLVRRAPNVLSLKMDLGILLGDMSKAAVAGGDYEESVRFLDESLEQMRELAILCPDQPLPRHNIATLLESRVRLLFNLGRFDESLEACEQGLAECLELERCFGSRPDYRLRRARLLGLRVQAHGMRNELAPIGPLLDEARRILEELVEAQQDPDPEAALCLSDVHMNYSRLHESTGRYLDAVASNREAIRVLQDLHDRGLGGSAVAGTLARYVAVLGMNLARLGKLDECLECYDQAIALYTELVESEDNPQWSDRLAETLVDAAEIHHCQQRREQARPLLERARDIRIALMDRLSTRDSLRLELFRTLMFLGDVQVTAGETEEGLKSWIDAIGHADAVSSDWSQSPVLSEQLPDALVMLAVGLERAGRGDEAEPYWIRASKLEPTMASMKNALAWFLATFRKPELRDHERAVRLAEKAVAQEPGQACHWGTLGIARYRAGEYAKAVDAFREAERLHQGAIGEYLFFAAMAAWQLDRKDEAREIFDRAVAWQAANAPDEPQLQAFRAEAEALIEPAATH